MNLVDLIVIFFGLRFRLNSRVVSYNAKELLAEVDSLFALIIKGGVELKKKLLPGVSEELIKKINISPDKSIPLTVELAQWRMLAEDVSEFRARFVEAHKDQLKADSPKKEEPKKEVSNVQPETAAFEG